MPIPSIQIRQQQTLLGLETMSGSLQIDPAKVQVQLETTHSQVRIEAPAGELVIDQSRAWDALSKGSNIRWNERLYTQMKQHLLQYIAKTAADGERLMTTAGKRMNTIPKMARENAARFGNGLEYAGPPSSGNVDVEYHRRQPNISASEGGVMVDFAVKPLSIEYSRTKVEMYIRQRGQVEIIPPQIEMLL